MKIGFKIIMPDANIKPISKENKDKEWGELHEFAWETLAPQDVVTIVSLFHRTLLNIIDQEHLWEWCND